MSTQFIDFRSDTVTKPTDSMRQAMFEAQVGDDVYGEDPTVTKLEELGASMLNKEAALFVTSGTMGNLLALLSHTQPGDEVILEAEAHIYYYEVGGLGRIGGLIPRLIHTPDGLITPEQLEAVMRPADIHYAAPSLFCLENTHNRAGGRVLPQQEVEEVTACAKSHGLATHLDGARIFNAAEFLGLSVAEVGEPFDSVMFCLSKGLGAPVGSLLVGSEKFIDRARRFRKMLGGGMRQAGVVAAAGITALQEMPEKIRDDHRRARQLGDALSQIDGLSTADPVETNIVMVEVTHPEWDGERLVNAWRKEGILASTVGPGKIRLVTHHQITDDHIEQIIAVTEELLS